MAFSGLFTFGGLSEYQTGIWLTLIIVLIYTSIGGFLAVSLTDFVQGCIMMLALVIMPVVILSGQRGGGVAQAVCTLSATTDPAGDLTWTVRCGEPCRGRVCIYV